MSVRPSLGLAVLCGCASAASTVPAARFANAPAVTIVDDRRDVAVAPADRPFYPNVYYFDSSLGEPVWRGLQLDQHQRALGVNALDEVPDSTWFTNRNAAHALSPAEITNGPLTHDPYAHRPWTIESTKVGGTTVGLIIKDTDGVKYLLKFDAADDPPEMETGTHLVCNRLLWAAGYNVAEDQILYIRPDDLKIGNGAKRKDDLGKTLGLLKPLDVDNMFKLVRHETDGRIRTLVSRWIDGKTIGGHNSAGVRKDDPNDTIPHERRRDLRGLKTLDVWTDGVDVTEGQFVDAYVADPYAPTRHYVKHYMIDFGKSLGAMGSIDYDWWRSRAYRFDYAVLGHEVITFGLDSRWWEDRKGPKGLRGVSELFDVESLTPGDWKPDMPGYIAFLDADRFDQYWGVKLVASFTPAQIRGAVEAAKFTDPRSVDALVDTLVKRQQVLMRYWFARVAPLERVATTAPGLVCFDDLAITSGLEQAATTRYTVSAFDFAGRPLGAPTSARAIAADATGHTCATGLPAAADHDGYTIYRIDTQRPTFTGTTYAHVARDPTTDGPRVIGIWRS